MKKRLLIFDENGFYVEDVIVSVGYEPKDNEYLAELDEVISFNLPKLVDGELVEGKEKELEEAEKPIEITTEDLLLQHILELEFMLLIK